MLKAIEMELETGHYSFDALQNALAVVGEIKGWYKEFGDMDEDSEKFREIIWVLSEKAITRAEILTPDVIEICNYQRDKLIKVERTYSITQCDENIKGTLQKTALTFTDGESLVLMRPKNRSNAEQYDAFVKLMG